MTTGDRLVFADEAKPSVERRHKPWKILIADDEEEIHKVTKLALKDLHFDNQPLEFLDAYTGRESVEIMRQHADVAIVLMDVVMETEHAGLDAVEAIRHTLSNHFVRIVLRTGQPGQAPEHDIITRYDINDYKEKTELTAKKLFTLVYTGLSLFQELHQQERHSQGLQQVISATARLFGRRDPRELAEQVLLELPDVLAWAHAKEGPALNGIAVTAVNTFEPRVLAGTGSYAGAAGQPLQNAALRSRLQGLPDAFWTLRDGYFAMRVLSHKTIQTVFYLECEERRRTADERMLEMFSYDVALALENSRLIEEVSRTQQELVIMLSEAIEKRSMETGYHVRRVGEYSLLLARLCGVCEDEAKILQIAAPLHDAGKIAIPDAILNKPGKLTPEEWKTMQTHAGIGAQLFEKHELAVLKVAAIVAAQHHEKWDGMGYPNRLRGEDIHLYGRITALADVFDALNSRRCYKEPWPLEDVLSTLRGERGRHFEPRLVDLFLEHLDEFLEIRDRLADPPEP